VLKKKIWPILNFQRIIELFTKKIVKKLLKIWSWDPGSEIRDPEKTYSGSRIPDPGVKKHPIPDPGSGSATLFKLYADRYFQSMDIKKSKDFKPSEGDWICAEAQ
jgi:hypothetical protein